MADSNILSIIEGTNIRRVAIESKAKEFNKSYIKVKKHSISCIIINRHNVNLTCGHTTCNQYFFNPEANRRNNLRDLVTQARYHVWIELFGGLYMIEVDCEASKRRGTVEIVQ